MATNRPNRPGQIRNSEAILSVRFTDEEVTIIRTLAAYHRLTVSELIRRAVLQHHALENHVNLGRSRTLDEVV